ncbi:MAG: hypothetical protein N0E58_08985 [Candidatus Thiodiazotropha endolucinida]|uniref:Uncharacterized protein n=1 Tax=Candidatus Thiodiazotropha taylori TaxID=2792791 RepID=A0A9E4NJZ4_9GAMM|nr:hypothetical protein [Candidatus Thiodiazotropha taylori]MCW4236388.1 hypothetical protein [Candidatus Thiodiazotropha endolucinida]
MEFDSENQIVPTWWETEERMSHEGCAAFIGVTPASLSSGLSRGYYTFKRYKVGRKNYYRKSEVVADIEQNHAV